jgi:uncharacterized membrane protein
MRFQRILIRQRIKEKARKILSGHIVVSVKLCLLLTAIYFIIQYIKIFMAPSLNVTGDGVAAIINAYLGMSWDQILSIAAIEVLAIIVLGPLLCSFCGYFLRITRGEVKDETEVNLFAEYDPEANRIMPYLFWFYQGSARNKAIVLKIATSLLSLFWHALFVGPPLYLLYRLRGNPNSIHYVNTVFFYTTCMLLGFLLAYVKLGTYYPAFFLISQDPDMAILEALRDSAKMMRGHAWEFFIYKLSFVPWYLLAVVTFGIGLAYIVQYRGVSDALFMRYVDSVSSGGEPL